jgi:pimeloyl-ACP methyl ester carboxylesterase
LVTALLLVVGLLLLAPAAYGSTSHSAATAAHDPIIFVHGYDGSAGQFESQKLRFVENGYPDAYVQVLEYDSSPATPLPGATGLNPAGIQLIEQQLFPRLDQLIAQLKGQTGRPQVELLAHSLGTILMQDYLNSSPQRAANVAHYVNIDGQTANAPPGGVSTLALWATKGPLSPPGRSITGAENVSIPDSTHVQCATSPLSFWWMYDFFTGNAPGTTDVVPQKGPITLSGRDVNFPQNNGLAGATLQLWAINQQTGYRTGAAPLASFQIGSSGDWGPVAVQAGKRYEFAEVRPGFPVHHFYYEPFIRSDHLIRLLESDPLRLAGGAPDPRSAAMVIIRYKELWGDQGSESDVVTVDGQSVCNPTTCPLSKEVNALFAADYNHDGQSETDQTWPPYQSLGYFVSSVDVFAPAQSPPTGEVTVALQDRGAGPVRTISFPNFPATTDVTTVQFSDYDPTSSP